jgi:cell fate (sporulation/competence/biofilm development) regulator YlbF (YheA/YmcA/DUF963 family)
MAAAEKLGQLVAQHPAVARYKDAQRAVGQDPEASRLMSDFGRQLETLARQEQSGVGITDAQRMQLESLQTRIASNLKVKALNLAEVEFTDLLRKVSQTWQRPLADSAGASAGSAAPRVAAAPKIVQ